MQILLFLFALLISIDIHECAHAWMANELGDPTARNLGRLTLNPIVHLDPMGTIMILMSALVGFGIGWGKPVPVNPRNLRNGPRAGMGVVAAAGPLSNILLASLVGIPLRVRAPLPGIAQQLLYIIVLVNVSLAIFNLIPIFPLDGYNVAMGILDTIRAPWAYRWADALEGLKRHGPVIFIGLIMVDQLLPISILGTILGPPVRTLVGLIVGA